MIEQDSILLFIYNFELRIAQPYQKLTNEAKRPFAKRSGFALAVFRYVFYTPV